MSSKKKPKKQKRHVQHTRSNSVASIARMIKKDVLSGKTAADLAMKYQFKFNDCVKAIDVLKTIDKDVEDYFNNNIDARLGHRANQMSNISGVDNLDIDKIKEEIETEEEEEMTKVEAPVSTRDQLCQKALEEYLNGGYTQLMLAKKYGITLSVLTGYIKHHTTDSQRKDIINRNKTTIKTVVPNEDTLYDALQDYKKGGYTYLQLAEKYKTTFYFISKYIKEHLSDEQIKAIANKNRFGTTYKKDTPTTIVPPVIEALNELREAENEKEEETVVEEPKPVVIKKITPKVSTPLSSVSTKNIDTDIADKLNEISIEDFYVTCGLVDNRHDMGIDKFVYPCIEDKDLFNFTKLERIAKNFITSNIIFESGLPKQGLIVRATGLQSALMSVVKACNDMHVNLIVAHYQMSSSDKAIYRYQPIFTEFKSASNVPYMMSYISTYSSKVLVYNSEPYEYENADEFYEAHIVVRPKEARNSKEVREGDPLNEYSILCTSILFAIELTARLQYKFTVDREYYRSIILRKYSKDSTLAINYNVSVVQRSYH